MDLVTPRKWLLNSSPLWALQLLAFYGPGAIAGGLALGTWLGSNGQLNVPSVSPYLAVVTVAVWILGMVGMVCLLYRVRRSTVEE